MKKEKKHPDEDEVRMSYTNSNDFISDKCQLNLFINDNKNKKMKTRERHSSTKLTLFSEHEKEEEGRETNRKKNLMALYIHENMSRVILSFLFLPSHVDLRLFCLRSTFGLTNFQQKKKIFMLC